MKLQFEPNQPFQLAVGVRNEPEHFAAAGVALGFLRHPNLLLRPFIQALQAIVAGSRDRTLADAPDLDYSMAGEILFLLELLQKPR